MNKKAFKLQQAFLCFIVIQHKGTCFRVCLIYVCFLNYCVNCSCIKWHDFQASWFQSIKVNVVLMKLFNIYKTTFIQEKWAQSINQKVWCKGGNSTEIDCQSYIYYFPWL